MSVLSDALVPSFSGRIPRRTYWLTVFVTLTLTNVLPAAVYQYTDAASFWYSEGFVFAASLYLFACYLLFFSALVRRLHDVGRTGAWALVFFIPLVGQVMALIMGCLSSAEGANRYGPNPDAAPDGNARALSLSQAASSPDQTLAALAELERLLEKGLISRDEFDRQKARLLSS